MTIDSTSKRPPLFKLLPALLLGLYLVLAITSMKDKSVTVDEYAHLPTGYVYWKTGDFHVYNLNPPLIQLLASAPLLTKEVSYDPEAYSGLSMYWSYGLEFMHANADNYLDLFRSARYVIVALGFLGGIVVFLWARRLHGDVAGLLALFFYALSPNILAHSRLVTGDIGTIALMTAALYCFTRWMDEQSTGWTIAAGVLLGLAELSKFSLLMLYAVMAVYFAVIYLRSKSAPPSIGKLIIIFLISLFIINAGYFFGGSFTPLSDFDFQSGIMQSVQAILPGFLPMPLPYEYLLGFDDLQSGIQGGVYQYLMGEGSITTGWWYYYLIIFLFKVPLAFLAAALLAAGLTIGRRLPRLSGVEILMIAFVALYLLSLITARINNVGFRYAMPALPLLFIVVSRIAAVDIAKNARRLLLSVIAICYAGASFYIFPHYLSFFNSVAGGPSGGHNYLIDSNIDWGQDMILLKKYMDEHGVEQVHLAYTGNVDPGIYGIDYLPLMKEARGVTAAVSINYLQGAPPRFTHQRKLYQGPAGYYGYLKDYPVKDRIGYSMLIIDIPPSK